jgi:hypothetical protein
MHQKYQMTELVEKSTLALSMADLRFFYGSLWFASVIACGARDLVIRADFRLQQTRNRRYWFTLWSTYLCRSKVLVHYGTPVGEN